MASAKGAPLAKAHGGLVVRADMFGAARHRHGGRLPKTECVERSRGPMTARFAMAITHRNRLTAYGEFDSPAEATRLVISHEPPPSNECQFRCGPRAPIPHRCWVPAGHKSIAGGTYTAGLRSSSV